MVREADANPRGPGEHLTVGQKVDLAREVTPLTGAPGVESHLQACADCRAGVLRFKALRDVLTRDAQDGPDAETVARAVALMPERTRVSALTRLIAALHYDSSQHPLPAGVRDHTAAEQLVYKADNVIVDLRLTREARGTLVIVGQVADVDRPSRVVGKVAVTLREGEKVAMTALSNEWGEFRLECAESDDLEVEVAMEEGPVVRIALPWKQRSS